MYLQGSISLEVVDHLYESLYLNAFVAFEGFLEELFYYLLRGNRIRSAHNTVPRVQLNSDYTIHKLLSSEARSYLNWLPYDRTIQRAEAFLTKGRPFSTLEDSDKTIIKKAHTIRNAIAHKSRYSQAKFLERVVQGTPLPKSELRPAGYLRGSFRMAPPQTRFENYLSNLLRIAQALT